MSFQAPTPAQYQPMPAQKPGNGFGIAALVLGIVAIVASIIPLLGTIAFILGPLAIVFGVLGILLRKQSKRGTSITGIILGAVAVVIAIIVTVITAAFVSSVNSSIDSANESVSSASAAMNAESKVEYIATSSAGEATAIYGSASGTSDKKFTGSWKADGTLKGIDAAILSVTGDFTTDGQALTCEIKIDGKSVVKNSGDSSVSCTTPIK